MRADARQNYDQLLAVAGEVIAEQGADASLRDLARRAGVGLGTLYRHFPTREALLEALLRSGFDGLTVRAGALSEDAAPDEALVTWLGEVIALAHTYSGVIALMVAAIDDPDSALHASCVSMKSAGAGLLARAQAQGLARADLDGADLFALVGALAWINDQPALHPRAGRLFEVITGALLIRPAAARPAG